MKLKIVLTLTLAFATHAAGALDLSELTEVNQKITGESDFNVDKPLHPVSNRYLDRDTDGAGVAYLRPVLLGILYRGGSGMKFPMNPGELQRQCAAGFGAVDFGYHQTLPTPEVTCGSHHMSYQIVSADPSREHLRPLFKQIVDAINNKTGPVLVHCWFGQHESGELATYALMQFCGTNVANATRYWETHANGSNSPQFNPVRTNIKNFDVLKKQYADVQISPADAKLICPAQYFNR